MQTKGFSPVCMRMCSSRELLSLQAFSQSGHIKLDVLVWVVICALKNVKLTLESAAFMRNPEKCLVPQSGPSSKRFLAEFTVKAPFAGVSDQMRGQVVLVAKDLVAKFTRVHGMIADPLRLDQIAHGVHGRDLGDVVINHHFGGRRWGRWRQSRKLFRWSR